MSLYNLRMTAPIARSNSDRYIDDDERAVHTEIPPASVLLGAFVVVAGSCIATLGAIAYVVYRMFAS